MPAVTPRDLPARLARLQVAHPACGCVSDVPAWKWDFGTVVGNGTQGVLAFCRPHEEELVLSHEELFLPVHPFSGYLPVREHYDQVQQLVLAGRAADAQALIHQIKVACGCPVYNTTDPFVGAGSLDLVMAGQGDCEEYARVIDFDTGESLTAWRDGAGLFHRHLAVSRADDLILVRLSSPDGSPVRVSVRLREIAYQPPADPRDRNIHDLTIAGCQDTVTDALLTHRMRFRQRWEGQTVSGCCTVGRVVTRGGSAAVADGWLRITDAEEVLLLVRTVPDRPGEDLSPDRMAQDLAAVNADYDALLARHAAIHAEQFGRCSLQLSASGGPSLSGEELIASSAVGRTSPALVDRTFAGARHGIISSTGRLPPALQGVWTGTWKPPWSGDYTLNGNVQSMVAASLCGNHQECMESLLDYLDALVPDFQDNARELLGFRGLLIPWRSSTHGRTHYLAFKAHHHNFPGIYWFAGAAWFAQFYYDYYCYTGDEEFFRRRLTPFLLEAVAFYEDYLTLEQDGFYVLAPSSSPENETDDDVWMAPNATMTIAAIKHLLRTVLALQDRLGVAPERADRWRGMLAKLPAYQAGASGALQEWTWPGVENRETHRHASHLYPLYFGVDPEIAASESLQEACRRAINARMDFRRPENGGDMAFGFVQLGMAAAHLGATDLAYEAVEYLVNNYWSPVMVSQHNRRAHPDILNMDISGGLPALIITMLVQSLLPDPDGAPWRILLLPCLPDAWPQGHLRGVRCRGGFQVDVRWAGGVLEEVIITSGRGEACRVEYGPRRLDLRLMPGESATLSGDLTPGRGRDHGGKENR